MFEDVANHIFAKQSDLRKEIGEIMGGRILELESERLLRTGKEQGLIQGAERMRGEDCHCHSNSALLWEVNKDKTVICTGYALSADGMWRQHSWLIHRKPRSNRVVETTEPRILYYGFAMTPELCEEFVNENVW